MTATVFCARLQQTLPALAFAPMPGELGQRILASVSAQAWAEWLAQQTMLINENRLSPIDPKARALLRAALEAFLFGQGAAPPPGYVAPAAKQ